MLLTQHSILKKEKLSTCLCGTVFLWIHIQNQHFFLNFKKKVDQKPEHFEGNLKISVAVFSFQASRTCSTVRLGAGLYSTCSPCYCDQTERQGL